MWKSTEYWTLKPVGIEIIKTLYWPEPVAPFWIKACKSLEQVYSELGFEVVLAYLGVPSALSITLDTLLPSHGFILNSVEILVYDWIEFVHIDCSNWEEELPIKVSLLCKEAYNFIRIAFFTVWVATCLLFASWWATYETPTEGYRAGGVME